MRLNIAVSVALLGIAGPLWAQDEPLAKILTPLRVELTLSRPQSGEPGASYTLYVLADAGGSTELRVGREVPVPVTTFTASSDEAAEVKRGTPLTSYQYRNVGMNVRCRAFRRDDRFRLDLNLERSSLHAGGEKPTFQTFNSRTELLLGDGETAELVLGSDPSLGEGWNVAARLQVLR